MKRSGSEVGSEYAALLAEARRADFSGWESAGRHNRPISVVGKTTSGADIFVFAPAVLGDAPTPSVLRRLLLYFLRETDAIINRNPRGYVMILHAATFGRSVASFLRRVYKLLGRAFKKNLRHMLILHPTYGLKTLVFLARPFVSKKVWSKVEYVATHQELMRCAALRGATYNAGCVRRGGHLMLPNVVYTLQNEPPPHPAIYFGCPLPIQPMVANGVESEGDRVAEQRDITSTCPVFVLDCIRVLEHGQGLTTQGIFRISADAEAVQRERKQLETNTDRAGALRVVDTIPAQKVMEHNDGRAGTSSRLYSRHFYASSLSRCFPSRRTSLCYASLAPASKCQVRKRRGRSLCLVPTTDDASAGSVPTFDACHV